MFYRISLSTSTLDSFGRILDWLIRKGPAWRHCQWVQNLFETFGYQTHFLSMRSSLIFTLLLRAMNSFAFTTLVPSQGVSGKEILWRNRNNWFFRWLKTMCIYFLHTSTHCPYHSNIYENNRRKVILVFLLS